MFRLILPNSFGTCVSACARKHIRLHMGGSMSSYTQVRKNFHIIGYKKPILVSVWFGEKLPLYCNAVLTTLLQRSVALELIFSLLKNSPIALISSSSIALAIDALNLQQKEKKIKEIALKI